MQPNLSYSATSRVTTVIQQAFAWMFGGLLVTAGSAYAAASDMGLQEALHANPIIFYGLMFAELGLVIFLSAGINRMSHTVAVVSFLTYALLNGITFSLIFLIYTGGAIVGAFLATSVMFGCMAVYGFVTKKDLTSFGSLAFMVIIGLICASVVNWFLQSRELMWAISYMTILIFAGLTAYDTQRIKAMATQSSGSNLGIYGALRLYLDFVNIFLALLRIFGGGRR